MQQEIEFHRDSTLPVPSKDNVRFYSKPVFSQFYTTIINTTISMQNYFFKNMQQEIEFQLGSTLPVKSCKMASLFYTSRH